MKLKLEIENKNYLINYNMGIDISIPMLFNGDQPNTYEVERASSEAYIVGNFVGDTRQGGSCNFDWLKIVPHCNGTHTECIGHLSNERININEILKDSFNIAKLITIDPKQSTETEDSYIVELDELDYLITQDSIENALYQSGNIIADSLIIRTTPNHESKKSRDYSIVPPPFFSLEAIEFIRDMGFKHLLVDFPSLDRLFDEGKLMAHRIFWNLPEDIHDLTPEQISDKTITEMIFVPDSVTDGTYILNIQIAPFTLDASPSRPMLFELTEITE